MQPPVVDPSLHVFTSSTKLMKFPPRLCLKTDRMSAFHSRKQCDRLGIIVTGVCGMR